MRICSTCGTENPDGANFCMGCATHLGGPASSGEVRKIISALFCDLVGSTSLGERHDPEVLRPILDGYFTAMRTALERHGGLVEKFIGDAVVAIFGLPNAHEDDALRAVRAGIEMQERLQTLNEGSPIPLEARIGIMTGEVLVPADGKPVIGDAMNTASRLQSGAAPGHVLIGEPTWRLVRGAVSADEVEPLHAKGKAEPVSVWRVLEIHPVAGGSETPLIGRDRHLGVLHRALQDVVEDEACVLVTILAPPGVGKSRLAAEFVEVVREGATVLVGQTPSYGGVTFASLVELLAAAAGRPSGDAEQVAAALRERLVGQPDGQAVGDRLAQVLGLGEALASDVSWAVRRLLEVIAADRPLVVVLEDVHWAETPMLDLADAVIERVHGPVLFLCLARPELLEQRPTWAAGKPRAITMSLPPLMPTEARRVAELLLGGEAPSAVTDRVCETAEGNPLYLEQLTAMLADQGLLVDGRWVGSNSADIVIPESLQALLASRLDRLDPTPRLILERASVEGRRFRIEAIGALTPDLGREEFRVAIAALEGRGFLQPEHEAAGRWRFAHALVRDAAYRGLSKELRADLHERLADWIAVEDADQADVDESVARHLEHALHLREELGARPDRSAALAARAGDLFAAAGSRAFTALDYISARDFLGRAAALLPEGSRRRMEILPNLGAALTDSGRADESDALLADAADEARSAGAERDALRASVQLLSNRIYHLSEEAELESASAETRRTFDVFEDSGDEVGMAETAIVGINLAYGRAHCGEAQWWATRAMFHALAAGLPREATQAAGDLFGIVLVGPVPFTRFAAEAEDLRTGRDPITDCVGHALLAAAALAAGDDAGFLEHDGRRRDVVDRHGLTWLGATHGMEIGFVELWAGRAEAAERRLREAQQFFTQIGNVWYMNIAAEYLCEAVYAQGRRREFLRLADAFAAPSLMTDRHNLVKRQVAAARAHLLRGSAVESESSARRALKLLGSTDLIPDRVDALLVLADALEERGMADEAATARLDAVAKLSAKANVAAIALLGTQSAR